MRAVASLRTPEAEALALRMRKHFAHKVPVELTDGVGRVRITAGDFELEPLGATLAVRASAPDEAALRRVREVVGSHLERFARDGAAVLAWDTLEARAEERIRPHRNRRHLLRTRDWTLELEPAASDALRLAALLHDVDRDGADVPLERQVAEWDDEDAVAEHAERAASIAGAWLRAEGARERVAAHVEGLVRLHEVGGSDEADVLQAADSLSFLDVNPAARWVREGLAYAATAERKLRWMHDRIRLPAARERAGPLLDAALGALVSTGSVIQDLPLAERMRQHATEGRAHGNTR